MSTNNFAQHFRIRSLLIQVALLSFLLLLVPLQYGQAASTIVVNSYEDSLSNDGKCTLREAIIAANKDKRSGSKAGECVAGSGADTIILPAGTYTLTRSDSGNENAAQTGDLDILDSLTLVGAGADKTIIQAISGNDRIFHVLQGIVSISGVKLTGGNVPQEGGAVYNAATLSLSDVIITGNHAAGSGGGLFNAGTLVMNGSVVAGNTAVLNTHELINTGTATITNSTISGHGLRNSGTTNLSFVTVVGETAVTGGALNTNNSIFTACTGTITSQGHNLIANTSGCTVSGNLTGNITNQDPLLGVLAVNSGPKATLTHALLVGSPAIEAGSNANCPAIDQRGVLRPIGLFCDIGAYESEDPLQSGETVVVNSDEDGDDGACTFLHCTLREAINAANGAANTIEFNISGTGPFTIQPLSPLPVLTQPVTLDGTSQPGGVVILDGSLAGPGANGLILAGGNSLLRGLHITNFDCNGVVLQSAGNNVIKNNTITNNGCHGIQILSGNGNTIQANSIFDNGLLGIAFDSDQMIANDVGDGDSGPNDRQNFPVLTAVVANGSQTVVTGRLNSTAVSTFTLEFFSNNSCDDSNFGEGETSLGTVVVTTDSTGNALFTETLPIAVPDGSFISATATNANGSTSQFSHCAVASPNNTIWPYAMPLTVVPDLSPTAVDHYLDQEGQSRWYKLTVQPHSRLNVTLTNLPANYDVTIYKDIAGAFNTLLTNQDLLKLSAEFAPNAFNPDSLAPDAFSSDAFAPDAFLPDAFLPDAFLPDAFAPDAFLPDVFLPDAFAPDAFLPDAFLPDAFLPGAFAPDAFLPDAFLPDAFLPDAFLSAQTRSLVAISAFDGTVDEQVSLNTWLNDGDFYIRVRGRQGAYSLATPFQLTVQLFSGGCSQVSPITTASSTIPVAGDFKTLILTDLARMAGNPADQAALEANLAALAARPEVAGIIINLSLDNRVVAANAQADLPENQACPYAKNLVTEAIKEIIDGYRAQNPDTAYIVVVGNDEVIPFFRYPDNALLANEMNYVVPVLNDTHSQSSLRLGYILTQVGYGSFLDISLKTNQFPVPDLPVGRLVETMADVNILLEAYLGTSDGTIDTPDAIAVTGYDFIEDAARAIVAELEAGTGAIANTLILTQTISPADPRAWTADDAAELLLVNRHDLIFLAGHFSANSMLAADYTTRLTTDELIASPVDFTNSIIFSLGCHAGYNIVNEHGVPDVTNILDWPQAFTQKGATLIAATGFAYGHTDFLKYSERLHLLFSQYLRTGSGVVSVGEAVVGAQKEYLATTEIRGIDEKSLLTLTIFGLPMLSVDMPGERLAPTSDSSIVGTTTTFATNPGATLGLAYADVTVAPSLTLHTKLLTNVGNPADQVIATYLSGADGVVANPSELVLPLQMENVSMPDTVLRGVGFRGGSYSDLAGIFPLTGVPVTEIRGVHTPFPTDIFYPVRMWQVNYFDLLSNPAVGQTRLMVTPAQFKSSEPGGKTGILRQYHSLDFRLYYSSNMTDYGGSVPALSAAPTIVKVTAVPTADSLHIQAIVTGNPAAGIQEVWVVYSDGQGYWYPLDLVQNGLDSKLWSGVLPLNGTPAEEISFFVQAVNGVGLVSMDSNQGSYHRLGLDDTPGPGATATSLALELVAANGLYSTEATFSAVLTSNGTPIANQPIFFTLGSQARQGLTDGNGRATVQIPLLSLPGIYQVRASFLGTGSFLPSAATADFSITKHPTSLVLNPVNAVGTVTDENIMEAVLSAGARRLTEKTIFFVLTGSGGSLSRAVITDNVGKAALGNVHLPPGTYNVTAYFSGEVTLHSGVQLLLDDVRYLPAVAVGTLTLLNSPPVAVANVYSTDQDVPLEVAAPGVLANDSDADGDDLTAVLLTNPTHGTLVFNSDGSFSYTPDPGFAGIDTFTYAASDGTDSSAPALVTIIVNSTATPPDCSQATTSITFIWPPDKRFVPVNILNVTDGNGVPATIIITAIHQDEPTGHGSNSPDGLGIGTDTAYVRAERAGNGNGRVYHIAFIASDAQGGSCSAILRLPVVPHNQSGSIDAFDEGPLYDSTVQN